MSAPATSFQTRIAYRDLRAYDVDPMPCELELADNTSQFGVPPAAQAAIARAINENLSSYPSTYSHRLREGIAAFVGVSPDEIMVGAGADEVMSCAFRALGEPGERIAFMDPTFVMTRIFATTNSLVPVSVPLNTRLDADAAALVDARAALTYLCTPNNPTGIAIARPALEYVLNHASGIVVVDEAYAEFAGTNIASEAPIRERMLVLRTFSKAFGLAGLRIGYAVGARTLIAELEKARGPFTVTTISERAALAAVTHDLSWVRDHVEKVVVSRDRFAAALMAAGFAPLPSATNFVLLPVMDAHVAMRRLRERGILVRPFVALPGIGDALRITIGPPLVMQRVVDELRQEILPVVLPRIILDEPRS